MLLVDDEKACLKGFRVLFVAGTLVRAGQSRGNK